MMPDHDAPIRKPVRPTILANSVVKKTTQAQIEKSRKLLEETADLVKEYKPTKRLMRQQEE